MYLQNDYEQNVLFIELSIYYITHRRLKIFSQYFIIKYKILYTYICFDFLINAVSI